MSDSESDNFLQNESDSFESRVEERLERMNGFLEKQLLMKDELITRLHDELDYYKNDAAGQFEDQLLKAVIKLRQSIKKNLSSEKFLNKDRDELLEEYRYVFEDLTDLLSMQNCDEIESQEGAPFDPAIHQPKAEGTDRPEKHRTVKCSLSSGYKKGTKTLFPERVIVYQYQENKE